MQSILGGYSVEVDRADENSWYEILGNFGDANIYQTWAYNAVRVGEENISNMVLKRDKEIVAAVQARIVKVPVINAGIAYVRWGPLWKRRGLENSLEDFRQIVEAMREEYVERRGLFLRIIPNEIEYRQNNRSSILEDVGFRWYGSDYRTLYLDLFAPLETIRENMSKSWRKHLNRAEKKGLTVIEGTDSNLFDSVERLYRETVLRKSFVPGISIKAYRLLQESLPDYLKMKIMVCHWDGQPIAGLIGSAIGEVGIELMAGTGNDGLELGGSYLLRWKMVEYLRSCGCHFYNLNGINPEKNPGGYQFKSGLCGKNGLDVEFIGTFDAYRRGLSYLAVRFGDQARLAYRKVNQVIKRPRAQKIVEFKA